MRRFVCAGLAAALACAAGAADHRVALAGSLGSSKALLMIDGQPHAVGVGESVAGIKLLGIAANGDASIESAGQRRTLRLNEPVSLGEGIRAGQGTTIVLSAGPGGHFITGGNINGRPVQFLVDTGATAIALSQAEADRIGIDTRDASRRVTMQTANGLVAVTPVTLNSVRVGDVEVFNVQAVVVPMPMNNVLLGNTFLTRFQMRRDNDTLTLLRKP